MQSSDKKKSRLVHIGPVINTLLSSLQIKSTVTIGKLTQIASVWSTVAGANIADNTKPTRLKGKLLYVNVSSSVWVQQLQFIKDDLISRINVAIGEDGIEDIKFKIGRI